MSKIHVNRVGESLGQFEWDEVVAGLNSGQFLSSDLAWREGMPEWKRLGDWPEIPSAPVGDAPPAVQEGPPWENRAALGFIPALIGTVREVLLNPGEMFPRMKRTGGFGAPLLFYVLLGSVGAIFSIFFQLIFQIGGLAGESGFPSAFAGAGMLVGSLFLVPLLLILTLFIYSGILHGCLWVIGVRDRPYETTFRVCAYGMGAPALLQVVPVCGGIASGIWGLVLVVIGLHKTQGATVGQAVLAVLLPLIVCCGAIVVTGVAIPGFASLFGVQP